MSISKSSRQNDSRFFSTHFLVKIYSSRHGSVVARVPEEFLLSLNSDWDTPLSSGEAGAVEIAAQNLFGVSTKAQFATAQVWTGASPFEITLPLEFYAEKNPKLEVVEPIVRLSRMALPSDSGIGGESGLFIPPGPRPFQKEPGDQITITVGNFLNFTKVVVISVNPTFVTRDMAKSGYPLRATCEVVFRSLFSLTGSELASMFNDPNMGTTKKGKK